MESMAYYAPKSIEELAEILAREKAGAKILAGGTDVVIQLREQKINPKCIVSLKFVQKLKGIKEQTGKIMVGPMTTFTELAEAPLIREKAFLLAQAAASVGSPQIRNAGTVGGNIANASPAGDTIPALIALDAVLTIASTRGERQMPLKDFFLGIGKNKLEADEFVKLITFDALSKMCGSAFVKLGRRNALAISRISMAAIVGYSPESNIVTDCRISAGSVAQNPFRLQKTEKVLLGSKLTLEAVEKSVSTAFEELSTTLGQRASAIYKKKAAPVLVHRALNQAIGQIYTDWEQKA